MENLYPDLGSSVKNGLLSALLYFFIALIGFNVIGPLIGFFVSFIFYSGSMLDMVEQMGNPFVYEEMRLPLLLMQGTATLVGLVLIPWIVLKKLNGVELGAFFHRPLLSPALNVLAIFLLVTSFMFVNSIFIEWNAGLDLPESMSGFENWARNLEDQAALATEFLISSDSISYFIIVFVVIAILPAIGEELVFRGILQNELSRGLQNPHLGIWIAAFLFSLIHFQFFGFVPRLLLGALFGYLYLWTGNLLVPMIAHLVQNGFVIVMLFLYRKEIINFDIETSESAPFGTVVIFAIITALIIYFYRKINKNQADGSMEKSI